MEQQYVEDYRFPLQVQDMNNEIIARLDDDSLYQLCKTNKQMIRTCLSDKIWALRANSPLAPLYLVRNHYNNWLDFYEFVLFDSLYGVTVTLPDNKDRFYSSPTVFTSIRAALRHLFNNMNSSSHDIRKLTLEQLVTTTPDFDVGKYGTITLIRKNENFKGARGIHGHLLYSVGAGNIVDTGILAYPDLVNIPILKISWGTKETVSLIKYVDFNGYQLAEAMPLPGKKFFQLSFNDMSAILVPIGPLGWEIYQSRTTRLVIVSGSVLNVEGMDKDKYYVAIVPHQVDYQGTTVRFNDLTNRNYSNTPDGINNLRWYITTYGTFYEIDDIQSLLPKGLINNI